MAAKGIRQRIILWENEVDRVEGDPSSIPALGRYAGEDCVPTPGFFLSFFFFF